MPPRWRPPRRRRRPGLPLRGVPYAGQIRMAMRAIMCCVACNRRRRHEHQHDMAWHPPHQQQHPPHHPGPHHPPTHQQNGGGGGNAHLPPGVLWRGAPCDNWRTTFDNMNFEGAEKHSKGGGYICTAHDPQHGRVWRVGKPAPDKRAEIRGAKGWREKVGDTYYLGWRWKFGCAERELGHITVFQWKSYGDHTQNYPFCMSFDGRKLYVTKYDPHWEEDRKHRVTRLWEHPAQCGEWYTFTFGVKLGNSADDGWIEFYFNNEKQELKTGGERVAHKTMDGDEVAPKWGVYNRFCIGHECTVDLADMAIARDYEALRTVLK